MDEERYTAIDRYLANEMDITERQAFEDQLQTDAVLAEQVALYAAAGQSLAGKYHSDNGEKAFRETLAALETEDSDAPEQKTTRFRWYTWAAAACIALLGMAVVYSILDKPAYKDYANFGHLELAQRGSSEALQQHAQEAFNSGAYEQAVVFFNTLLQQEPQNTGIRLHKGIALLELNRIEEAETIFQEITTTPSVYRTRAQWLLALSALKQKQYDRCKTLLEAIPPDAEEYTVAQKLISDL